MRESVRNLDPEHEMKPTLPAELGLVAAVIERAVRDIMFPAKDSAYKEQRGVMRAPNWIFDNSEDPWSFTWCLSQLYGNPSRVRSAIRRLITEHLQCKKIELNQKSVLMTSSKN